MSLDTAPRIASAPPTDEELLERFRPVFDEIRRGAVERELTRTLPFGAIELLRQAGFGALRVPREHGGIGASLRQYALLLVELAAADSNIAQALRGHFGFVESRIQSTDAAQHAHWFPRIAEGLLFGNAQSERDNVRRGEQSTRLTRSGPGWVLDGTKYYTTGSIFADWLVVTAALPDGGLGTAFVNARAVGVERLDDWGGFGQRLTGSGTTRFEGVVLEDAHVETESIGVADSYQIAFFQLTLLAALAGVAQAALADVTAFVQKRRRHLQSAQYDTPGEDPAVQGVVGEIAGLAAVVRAAVLDAAGELDRLGIGRAPGERSTREELAAGDAAVFRIQATVIDLVLRAASRLFEVGGGSAVETAHALDRHWRNARAIGSHNPAVFRNQLVGDYLLNGVPPARVWAEFYGRE